MHLQEKDRHDETDYRHSVHKPVGNNRTQQKGKRHLLTPCHITAPPYLPQAGKQEIHGISAENGIGKGTERGRVLQSPQLQLPAQSPHDVAHHTYDHRQNDPAIFDFRLQNARNLLHVEPTVKRPKYGDSATQGNQELQYVTHYFFQLFLNLSD